MPKTYSSAEQQLHAAIRAINGIVSLIELTELEQGISVRGENGRELFLLARHIRLWLEEVRSS